MAINPMISLGVEAPQTNPLQAYGQALTLRSLIDRNKQQQLQTQMQQRELDEWDALSKAVTTSTSQDPQTGQLTIDHQKVMNQLAQGGHGHILMKYQTGLSQMSSAQLEEATKKLEYTGKRAQGLASLAATAVDQQTYENAMRTAIQSGYASPEELRQLPERFEEAGPILKQIQMRGMDASAISRFLYETAQREHEKKMWPMQERKAESEAKAAEQNAAGTTPITPYQQAQLGQMNENRAAAIVADPKSTPEDKGRAQSFLNALAGQKGREAAATQAATLGGGALGGPPEAPYKGIQPGETVERNEAALAALSPSNRAVVRAMVEGRYPIPTGFAMSKPYWQKMLSYAAAYEPGFDATQWRVRLDTRVDFAKGKAALQIRSLNTLVKHLNDVWDASQELGGVGMKAGNWPINVAKNQFGSLALKKYRVASQAAATEFATLLKGAAPTIPEIEDQKKIFDEDDPLGAKLEAVRSTLHLAFGRMEGIKDQYKNAFRRPIDFRLLTTTAAKICKEKLGVDPTEIETAGVGGGAGSEMPATAPVIPPSPWDQPKAK